MDSWITNKIIQGIAALVGGLSMAILWLPKRLMHHGKVVGVMIAGGLSALSGMTLTGIVAMKLGIVTTDLDILIGVSMIIGAVWIALLNLLANTFQSREGQKIEDVISEIRKIRKPKNKKDV